MPELHTRQVDKVDATAIKRARKNEKEQLRGDFCMWDLEPFYFKWSKMRRLVVGSTTQIPEIMKEDEVNKSTSLLSGSPIQSQDRPDPKSGLRAIPPVISQSDFSSLSL